jgi:hypothetical protein
MRRLSGVKTSFSGQGAFKEPSSIGPDTGIYKDADGKVLSRLYDDGSVHDVTTNPIADAVAPGEGQTNSWNFLDARQSEGNGVIAFHSYSVDILDTAVRETESKAGYGLELAMSRDMGRVFGTRASWRLTAGMSVNDISASTADSVFARVTTVTDRFQLFGTAPTAPYSAPSQRTDPVLDSNGVQVVEDGVPKTVTVDTTVLLGNAPLSRSRDPLTNSTSVQNRWTLKGAYYTFRFGPTLWVPITNRLRASLSVGGALIYSGTTYTVVETFQPEIGSAFSETSEDDTYKLLPGYYVDASVQFDLTERTGFYAGAVLQSAGNYTQKLTDDTSNYSTKVDFANQNGMRAGMSIRF